MKYELINKSWSKRRPLDKEKEILDIRFVNFKKEINHFCTMIVIYHNMEEELFSRVLYDEYNNCWLVDGLKVAVKIIE